MNYQTQQDPVKELSNWETRIIILGKRRNLPVIFGVDLLELCVIFSYNLQKKSLSGSIIRMKQLQVTTIARLAFLLTVIPAIFLILVLFIYTIHQNDRQNELLMEEYEQNVVISFEQTLDKMSEQMKELARSATFRAFANSSIDSAVRKTGFDLLDSALQDIRSTDEAIAVVFYNTKCDFSTKVSKKSDIFLSVTEKLPELVGEGPLSQKATYTVLTVDDQPVVVFQLAQRYGNLFLVIDPLKNPDFVFLRNLQKENGELCFSTEELSEKPKMRHQVTETRLDSLYLHYYYGRTGLSAIMDSTQRLLLPLIILVILFIPTVFILFLRRLTMPMVQLTDSFRIVGEGDRNYRIEKKSSIREVQSIYSGFDTMMDSINEAEEKSRRSELDMVQAKLQYLQLQIRPHFYLNCLKNISSMADLKKTDEIRELVLFLSGYLRYSFQDVMASTTLMNELEAVKGYVSLMKCMSPNAELNFSLDSDTLDARCLPLTGLSFIENCFKYQNDSGILQINVSTELQKKGDESFVKLVIANNGGGFDQEIMDEINQADPSVILYRSERVGIANVKYRLWLAYKEKASVLLSSQDDWAVVTVSFPYEPSGQLSYMEEP